MTSILNVDDSASVRWTVKMALTGEGFDVAEACDGAEGLRSAASGQFDLIITDFNMPEMNGLVPLSGPAQTAPVSAQCTDPVLSSH